MTSRQNHNVASHHLHHSVEELLSHARPALDPRLLFTAPEELGRLQDGHVLVGEVGRRFPQELRPRAEVGVEDYDDLPGGTRERVPKVSRFL